MIESALQQMSKRQLVPIPGKMLNKCRWTQGKLFRMGEIFSLFETHLDKIFNSQYVTYSCVIH